MARTALLVHRKVPYGVVVQESRGESEGDSRSGVEFQDLLAWRMEKMPPRQRQRRRWSAQLRCEADAIGHPVEQRHLRKDRYAIARPIHSD